MSNSNLNLNYKISETTLNSLCSALARLGFEDAFDIALARSLDIVWSDPESMIITEYLSWSHHLSSKAAECEQPEIAAKYAEAAIFYRKLSHHVYWAARKTDVIDYNPSFLQAVK